MRRSLGLFDLTCIGLNAIVGSGIFLLPDDIYRQMGGLSPLAFVLCGFGLLPVALCYAEAARRVEHNGGPYLYTTQAFGGFAGYCVGFMCFANAVFSFAAVASAAAAYLGRLLPALSGPTTLKVVAVGLIGLFAALNYRGARPGAIAIDLFTFGKFSVLLILVAALVPSVGEVELTHPPMQGLAGIGSATFIALFAVQGFEVVPVPAGEARAAQRTTPIAILASLIVASTLYVAVQTVLVATFADLGQVSDTPLADAALGVAPSLGFLVAIGGVISTLGFVSGSALGTPRYLQAIAADRHLPAGLAAIHPRFDSPHRAVLTTAAIAALLVVPFDYRSLIGMSNVSVAVQYAATCLAVLKFRAQAAPNGAPTPRQWLVPALGTLVSVWIVTEASSVELVWATASLLAGLAALALTRKLRPSG